MEGTKRQELPPGLWVVATPLGNLADATPRMAQALEQAEAVLCEDTRRTAHLCAALGLRPRLERYDAHSSPGEIDAFVARLVAGGSLALVTDAGTPAISDPGARLVDAAWAAGVRITPVPGPTAPAVLLSVAGFREGAFRFGGFFPRKDSERERAIDEALSRGEVTVWFESPQRILAALSAVAERSPASRVIAAKELSKLHERLFRGEASGVLEEVRQELEREGELGEWSFALEPPARASEEVNSSEWVKALQCLLDSRVSASESAKRVSQIFGVSRNEVYRRALELKNFSCGG